MNAISSTEIHLISSAVDSIHAAGFSREAAAEWLRLKPALIGDYALDTRAFSQFAQLSHRLLEQLPAKSARTHEQGHVAEILLHTAREAREDFLTRHVQTVYSRLTDDYRKLVGLEELAFAAAQLVAGLTPTPQQVAREAKLPQAAKDGVEIDQGIFFCHVLNHTPAGLHLCHALLLPRQEAVGLLPELLRKGSIDLGLAQVERHGKACFATMSNPRFLNAEDDETLDNIETAVDLCLLHPHTEVAVLRGAPVHHPKHQGQRVFNAGINLTKLYQGKISYLFYLKRELGFLNKMFRGLAQPDRPPESTSGGTLEKPWIAQVDKFAIGGGCQCLLVMDYIVAGSKAYMTLPARKEGIIPGAANLRLPRFIGDRAARQAVMMDRRIDCDTALGRQICDQVVAPEAVEQAVMEVVERFTNSGVVSFAANRRAFRAAHEPLDLFRQYMSVYAREQAYCHFSPALLRNLILNWQADQRQE